MILQVEKLAIRKYIPAVIRRNFFKSIFDLYLRILWKIWLRKFTNVIVKGEFPSRPLLKNLIYSWGNLGYSSQVDYLESMVAYSLKYKSGACVFECGSGLSTVLLGVIAKYKNFKVISIEHSRNWAGVVEKEIKRYSLKNNILYV